MFSRPTRAPTECYKTLSEKLAEASNLFFLPMSGIYFVARDLTNKTKTKNQITNGGFG